MNAGQVRRVGDGDRDGDRRHSDGTVEPSGDELADRLSEIALSLQAEDDLEATLQAIVDAAAEAVPGGEHVSLTMVAGRHEVTTRAATDDLPRRVDQAQYETGEGPCLDTLYQQRTAQVPDMAAERRWSAFAERATALGVNSMMSIQLFVRDDDLGVLNFHNEAPHAFTDESEHVAGLFAAHAAVAMIGAQDHQQLRDAITFRDVIGQAKGILMERFDIDGEAAFKVLTRVSQNTHRKLRDIAQDLVRDRGVSGQIPGRP